MNNRMTSRMNALSASLQLVRAEAVKRNAPAALERVNTSCTGAEDCWTDGWNAFVERDGISGLSVASTVASGNECIQVDNLQSDSYAAGSASTTGAPPEDCLLWQEGSSDEVRLSVFASTETTSGAAIQRVEFGAAGTPRCLATQGDNVVSAPPDSCYFVFCDSRGDTSARALLLSTAGHIRVSLRDPLDRALTCPNDGG
jgi:hypothetical protein